MAAPTDRPVQLAPGAAHVPRVVHSVRQKTGLSRPPVDAEHARLLLHVPEVGKHLPAGVPAAVVSLPAALPGNNRSKKEWLRGRGASGMWAQEANVD